MALAAGVAALTIPRPATSGLVLVNLSSSAGTSLADPVAVLVGSHRLTITGAVPKAPGLRTAAQLTLAPGSYRVTVGTMALARLIQVRSGQATPVLIGVDQGQVRLGSVWIGTSDSSLGLNELQGAVKPMPAFSLVDQSGTPFDNASLIGRDTLIAAFDTGCRASCPIYASLYSELRHLDPSLQLVEITVDPTRDTPAALNAYRAQVGAGWTFVGGGDSALSAFWAQFGAGLSSGDLTSPVLLVVDPHGYLRATFRGVPYLSEAMPAALKAQLDSAGRAELSGSADGWGAPQVLAAVASIPGGEAPPAGRTLAGFTLPDPSGRRVSLSSFSGRPVVIDFWRSDCVPCQEEMPLLVRAQRTHPDLAVLLVDEGQSARTASAYARAQGFTGEVLLDSSTEVGVGYHVVGYPTTFFLRPDGSVEGEFPGVMTGAELNAALGAIGA